MYSLILIALLAGDPPCHDEKADDHKAHAAHATQVDQRGDHVMGFSHEKTKHAFRLHADGGAVEVRANDGADDESIAAIRAHLKVIASEFRAANFARPQAIHDQTPDGADVMKELAKSITYRYEEIEQGGRVRIKTDDKRAIEAVHRFLRFQIDDHRTGDSGKIE